MTGLQITWLVSILLLILMVWGVPIGVVLCLIPFAGVVAVKGDLAVGATSINTAVFFVTSSATYVVVPMFVLMGLLAGETGITEELFDGMEKWLGWLPGGLAIATSFACAGLAAITGSSLGECVAMAKIAYPEMKKRHYDDALATGVIASAATFALMIPPSIMLAVYAILGDQSIGRCLMAGILPGIITAVAYALLILGRCWLNPRLGPPGQSFPWKARFSSLLTITPFVILILVIVGGILFGVWTPTEAASTAIVVVLVMALARRRLRWKAVVAATRETVVVVGSIFLIIAGSVAYGKFLALTGATDVIIQWLIGL